MEEEIVTIEEEVEELMTTLEEDVLYCNDYELLENKPKIDGVELDKGTTSTDLGLATLTDLSGKVDKVTGKGLSTNDLTNELKQDYDSAVEDSHTHSNKINLDNVSGTNTGDETNSTIISKIGFTPENVANKGQALGYCGLDGGSKVPLTNLPSTLLKYIGTWNANTNTPTLENPDTTKKGNVYVVSVSGTQFGISFKMGDWLIYNDSGVPEKSDNSDDVVSVNSKTGTVVLNTDDLSDSATKRFVTDTEKGVWNGKQDSGYVAYTNTKTSLDSTLIVSTMYELGTLTGNISMALPSGTTRKRICVKFNCGATPYTFTLTGTNFTTFSLTPVANTCYDVEFEYNGATSKWTGYVNSYLA